MAGIIDSFLVSLGFTIDEGSRRSVIAAAGSVEKAITQADQRVTRAQTREATVRALREAKTFDAKEKALRQLEVSDKRTADRALRRLYRQASAEADTAQDRLQWLTKLKAAQHDHNQRAISGLRTVATAVVGTAALVQGAAVAVSGFAQKAAERLEALAYSSDRTRSSVASLKSFSAAVAQLGGSAGAALNDIEGFAAKLRENPQGYANFLKKVGVNAYDAKGNLRGAVELYKEFRTEVGKKPYHNQLQYMQEMGVSEETWRATDPAKLAEQERIQRDRYARMNFDPDAAKDDAIKLQQSFRGLGDTLGIIGEKAASAIFKQVGPSIETLTGFLEKNGDKIADVLAKVAQIVLAISQALLELATSDKVQGFLGWLLGAFGKVDEGSGKWVADIGKIQTAMEALAVFIATVFVAKLRGAIADSMGILKPFLQVLGPILGALGFGGSAVAGVAAATAVGADLATPNNLKPGLLQRSEEDNAGAAGGAGMLGAIKRGYGAVKRGIGNLFGVGAEAREGPPPGAVRPLTREQLDIGKGSPEVEGYIRKKAAELGIDPDTAVAVANSEALRAFDPNKADGGGDGGTSFGPYQLHYGGKGTGPNASPGLGDEFTRETGKDARDHKTWREQVDFALGRAKKGGWGPWYGARNTGIGRWQGIPADKAGDGRLGLGGTAAMRGTEGVDPRLLGIIGEASKSLPDGYSAKIISGLRPGDSRFHGQGLAADVAIYDREGKKLPNYQDAGAFREYEKFAQAARKAQMERHPDLEKAFRWGGYFGGGPGKYGALDTMHFDLGGNKVGMGGGSWEKGLTPEQRQLFPGVASEGMGRSAFGDPAARVGAAADRLRQNAEAVAAQVGAAASKLDAGQMGVIGKATQGFNPKDYFTAPPLGDSTTNNSTSKNLTYKTGDVTNHFHGMGSKQEALSMYERHRERQMANDHRYATSMYAQA